MTGDSTHSGRWRALAANAALAIASLLFSLLALEGAARILSSPDTVRHPSPFFKRYNNRRQYRDYLYKPEKPAGRFRIIVGGDSFTAGGGVNFDDTYPKKLERYLNSFSSREKTVYQVINFGKPRSSTPQEVRAIRRLAPRYDADLIVVGYCLNDAEDWFYPDGVTALRKKYTVTRFTEPAGAAGVLYRHLALAQVILKRWHSHKTFYGQQKYFSALYQEDYKGWRRTRKAMSELGEFSRENGIPAVVVIFPLFSFGLDDDYPFTAIHDSLHRALESAGLSYIDLLPQYRGMDKNRLEVVPYRDPHPSELAHRIAAENLWEHLVEKEFIPTAMLRGTEMGRQAIPPPYR